MGSLFENEQHRLGRGKLGFHSNTAISMSFLQGLRCKNIDPASCFHLTVFFFPEVKNRTK